MQMRKSLCQLAFVVAAAVIVSGCSTFRHEEVNVPLNTLPVLVQATIQAHTYGGTVAKIEKETTKCGIVYEAKVMGAEGQCSEVKVADDGKLLKYKTWNKKCPFGGDMKQHDKAGPVTK